MPEIEAISSVRDFLEAGGDVLLVIGATTFAMWSLILERFWYFRVLHPRDAKRVQELWNQREDHSSWNAHQIRRLLASQVDQRLGRGLRMIKTLVAICPLLGLLGTVTGMIEVFDVMALAGSGNARAMAAGVTRATIPTMAGMVAALSGFIISVQIERFARDESARVADGLVLAGD
jgi:biopolymer transport protein ExbB